MSLIDINLYDEDGETVIGSAQVREPGKSSVIGINEWEEYNWIEEKSRYVRRLYPKLRAHEIVYQVTSLAIKQLAIVGTSSWNGNGYKVMDKGDKYYRTDVDMSWRSTHTVAARLINLPTNGEYFTSLDDAIKELVRRCRARIVKLEENILAARTIIDMIEDGTPPDLLRRNKVLI